MTYAASETSLQSGQPVELYRFVVGRIVQSTPEGLITDGLEYVNQAAAEAAGWAFTGSWTIGATDRVEEGTYAWKTGGGTATKTYTSSDGIVAGVSHTTKVHARMDEKDWYDTNTFLTVNGTTGASANMNGFGTLPEEYLVHTVTAGGGATLQVVLTRTAASGRTAWFDALSITVPATGPEEGTAYTFTSADVDVVFNAETYTSAILTRSPLVSGGQESASQNLELTLPRDHALVDYCSGPPRLPVSLTVYRLHRSDLTANVTPWKGQVVGLKMSGAQATIICAPIQTLLERRVPRYLTQRTCGHMFGDSLCQKDLASVTSASLTVAAISGLTVTVTGAAAAAEAMIPGFTTLWENGYLTAPDGTLGSIRSFDGAEGDDVTLKMAIPGLAVSDTVTLTAGCNKTIVQCDAFGRTASYGGERVMPIRNPGTGAGLGVSDGSSS